MRNLKKSFILTVAFALSGWMFAVSAQDMIILKDGNTIRAKVMEIHPTEIRYKRFDNLDGPMIIILSSGVHSIRYANGTTDIINADSAPVSVPAPEPAPSNARVPAPAATPAPAPANARTTAAAPAPPPAIPPEQRVAEEIAGQIAGQIVDQLSGTGGAYARQNFVQESLQTILNAFPAIPIAGNNLKFLFARERWTATVNGENYLAGNIEVEETDGGFLLKLGQTHIWPGAVGKSVGRIARLIPGGGAASNVLNTASSLAGSLVGAVEMSGPLYVLEYITGPGAKLSFLRIEDTKDNSSSAQAQPSTNREQSSAVPGASISAQPRTRPPREPSDGSGVKGAIGVSLGSSFSAPWFITTVYGSIAASKLSSIDLGIDVGLVSGYEKDEVSYFSLYPFVHYTLNLSLGEAAVWYAGLGVGYMFASYQFAQYYGETLDYNIFATDISTGFIFGDWFTISYTLRTNFSTANNKVSIGYIKRFY